MVARKERRQQLLEKEREKENLKENVAFNSCFFGAAHETVIFTFRVLAVRSSGRITGLIYWWEWSIGLQQR